MREGNDFKFKGRDYTLTYAVCLNAACEVPHYASRAVLSEYFFDTYELAGVTIYNVKWDILPGHDDDDDDACDWENPESVEPI